MRIYYPAILEHERETYGVSFPDLAVIAAGDSAEAAFENAATALQFHLEGLREDGQEPPEPSRLDDIPRDPEVNEVGRLLVPADLPEPAVKISVTLDAGLLRRIDDTVAAKGYSGRRSGFLAEAARRLLASEAEA